MQERKNPESKWKRIVLLWVLIPVFHFLLTVFAALSIHLTVAQICVYHASIILLKNSVSV